MTTGPCSYDPADPAGDIASEADVRAALRRLGDLFARMSAEELDEFHDPTFLDCASPLVDAARSIIFSIRYFDWRSNRRESAWFTVGSGWRFWPEDPRPGDFNIEDVASSLSRVCRFNGHLGGALDCGPGRVYSVAHHCVLMADFADDDVKFLALMHDAPEAYLCDLPTPVKRAVGGGYRSLEDRCWAALCRQYHIDCDAGAYDRLKELDARMLHSEARLFFPPGYVAGDGPAASDRGAGVCYGVYGGRTLGSREMAAISASRDWTISYTREQFLERYRRHAPASLRQVWCRADAAADRVGGGLPPAQDLRLQKDAGG